MEANDYSTRHDVRSTRALVRLPSSSTQRRLANQGLQDIFDWLGGENWRCRTGWLDPGSDVREWYGLTITGGGAIPESLGQLRSLEELFLHGNRLTGEIPSSLGNLRRLRKLFLNSNDLVGPVPQELGRLLSLDTLNLSWNNLSGEVPASVRALENLQVFSIEGNEELVLSRDVDFGGRDIFGTGGSTTAWEAAEEAIELHTATHVGAGAGAIEVLPK